MKKKNIHNRDKNCQNRKFAYLSWKLLTFKKKKIIYDVKLIMTLRCVYFN